ncbi:glycosyltransferase family 9 protein [Desulfovibrio sp. TomC]|uniref:glycosyltransferase family 9 protein n=1 Tax=Desulfovibrio sp. TomC TaxID=1562888 RepID=UPI0005752D4A|nr:glycosyltransferase family 9 protein [Desulfovibrio sp. TomC]KHK04479.1 heptosyltransferase family protein [Desulfovibrio sp. TomC]
MNIVLQNLTRFGDLLQSQPALAELAGEGHAVSVACLENFAGAAALLPEASAIFPLPGARFLAGLAGDWRQALVAVTEFTDAVASQAAPQTVVNLTAALSARLLARRLCGDAVRGFSLDAFGFRHESTPWAAFLEASSARRGLSPFNVVDLFRKSAGVGQGRGRFALKRPGGAESGQAAALFADVAAGALAVGFQLGASAAARQWPVARFARVASLLWERLGTVAVLVGTGAEKSLAARFRELYTGPCLDLVGATGLPLLAAVTARLALLVTNDTGTLHLAAGLGVPSVAVFLATAQPFDTGPYLEGCLCLEPDMPCHPCPFGIPCSHDHACLEAISPDAVAQAVVAFCHTGAFAPGRYPGARAWVSAFDAAGFMDLVSLTGHDSEPRAIWLRHQRHVLRQFLDDTPFVPPIVLPAALPDADRQALVRSLAQSADMLRLVEGQAVLAARNQAMKSRFLASYERINSLWAASPHLAVLGQLWQRQAQEQVPNLDRLVANIRRFAACVTAFTHLVEA